MSRPTNIRNGYIVYLRQGDLTWVESPLRTKVRSVPESCLNYPTVSKVEAATDILEDLYLVARDNGVDATVATSGFATGTAMAYSSGYRITIILVGPVATDTASLDHFESSWIGDTEEGDVSLLVKWSGGSLTCGMWLYNDCDFGEGWTDYKPDCWYLCQQKTVVPRCASDEQLQSTGAPLLAMTWSRLDMD
jgi:hypothetical protein